MSCIAQRVLGVLLLGSVTACATFKDTQENNHEAICKQLKYQIIWNGAGGAPTFWGGATGDQMQGTQTRAETETLEKNYHDEGCM